MNGNCKFYVYAYFDPRKPGHFEYSGYTFNFEPFYIGKGKDNRIYAHLKNELKDYRSKFNKYKTSKIFKILNNELKPIVAIVKSGMTESEAFYLEKNLISLIGRKNSGGPLTNLTDGGEGSAGRILSDETKNKIRSKAIGRIKSKETCLKLSKNNSGEGNPNFGNRGERSKWYGKNHTLDSIKKMQKPKTKEELQKRHETRKINCKIRINITGKLQLNNISIIEASDLTKVSYKYIYYGVKNTKRKKKTMN